MKHDFGFFKANMPETRKSKFHLGCLDGSVFIDFNLTHDNLVSLARISFDGFGCCEIQKEVNLLNVERSKDFIEEITKDKLNQKKLTPLVQEIIKINRDFIWADALKEYNLIDKEE